MILISNKLKREKPEQMKKKMKKETIFQLAKAMADNLPLFLSLCIWAPCVNCSSHVSLCVKRKSWCTGLSFSPRTQRRAETRQRPKREEGELKGWV
jgi:hypothetical protein